MARFGKTLLPFVLCFFEIFSLSAADVMLEEPTMWEQTMDDADWIKQGIRGDVNELIFYQYPAANVSRSCKEGMDLYSKALDEWKPWAVQMADASAKLPAGILAGTRLDFGAFEECLGVKAEGLQGQFCMAGLSAPILNSTRYGDEAYIPIFGHPPPWIQNFLENKTDLTENGTVWLGICLPSTCSEMDIKNILSTSSVSFHFDVTLTDCQVDEPKKVQFHSKIAMYGLSSILTLCVVGTLFDLYYKPKSLEQLAESSKENEGFAVAAVKMFSFRVNLYRLTVVSEREHFLNFFHGFRVMACFFQVLIHQFMYPNRWQPVRTSGVLRPEVIFYGFERHLMDNASIWIEIFFVLSGFLTMFSIWSKLEKNGGYVNIPLYFLKRCWRVFPPFLFVVALYYVVPLLNRGPIWTSHWEFEVQGCRNNIWRNFLFVSNYWGCSDGQCLLHTWFISALMQIQILAVFLILFTFRWRTGGIIVGFLAVATSSVLLFIKSVNYREVPPTFATNDADYTLAHYDEFYLKTLIHIGPYAVGMVAGYIVLKHRENVPSKKWQVVGWAATAVAWWWTFYGMALIPPQGDAVQLAIYIALNRLFWCMGFAWITYACAVGIAETLNGCLSWKPLAYLSNLNYTMYLLHPLLVLYRTGISRERMRVEYPHLIYNGVAVFVMGYAFSFFAYLAVESPFSILEWHLLGSDTAVKSKPESEEKKTT